MLTCRLLDTSWPLSGITVSVGLLTNTVIPMGLLIGVRGVMKINSLPPDLINQSRVNMAACLEAV